MNKLLSIVIPTFNMASLLPRCLESLVKPCYSDLLEVLVINDGSKDDSLAIARMYAEQYPTIIRVIDKENGNYGSAVNRGIEEARGKYFKILDADDFYDNRGLSSLLTKLIDLDVDLVLTNYRRDRGTEKRFFSAPQGSYDKVMSFNTLDITKFKNFAMHGISYRTSILRDNNIRLQHGISYTDSEFCFYPLPFVKTVIALDIVVYCYQLGRPGQTVEISSQLKGVKDMAKISQRMHDYLISVELDKDTIKKLSLIYCNVNRLCFLTLLCFDVKDNNLNTLDLLKSQILEIPGAHEYLMKDHLFGIKFYRRYIRQGCTSHGFILSNYYKFIKFGIRTVANLKQKVGLTR